MNTIKEFIGRNIEPEVYNHRDANKDEINTLLPTKSLKADRKYEHQVFNFLCRNRDSLGIRKVFRFKNLTIDGEIELIDGRLFAIEIKLRMNWLKACQSIWQFSRFLTSSEQCRNPIDGAIVFFEEFSADWLRKAKKKSFQNGWNHWYADYSNIYGNRIDLLRMKKNKIEGFPISKQAG